LFVSVQNDLVDCAIRVEPAEGPEECPVGQGERREVGMDEEQGTGQAACAQEAREYSELDCREVKCLIVDKFGVIVLS